MHKLKHLVEVGDHVAIDVGVYLATEAVNDYITTIHVCIIGGVNPKLVMGDFVV
jgi:hypothetical protein